MVVQSYNDGFQAGMRPEKVDRVKKKHLDQKKGDRNREDVDDNTGSGSVSQNKKLDVVENVADIADSIIHDEKHDIEALVEECLHTKIVKRVDLVICPSFQLTYEEEFKIVELFVRNEHLMDGLFRLFFQFPGFLESFQKSLLSIGHGEVVHPDFIEIIDQRCVYVHSDLASGGTIRQSLDMFDEFKNVSEKIKNQVLQFSMSVFRVCNR